MNMSSMIDLIGAKPVEPATNRIGLSLSRSMKSPNGISSFSRSPRSSVSNT